MVCRILHKRHSRVTYFLRIFCWVLLPAVLLVCAVCYLLEPSSAISFGIMCGGALVGALVGSWRALRRWDLLDWFTPEPRELFLTMVEEGLILESPARGYTVYLPWQGLSYRCRAGVLNLSYFGVHRALVSFHGVEKERQQEILRQLRCFAGEQQSRPFAPQEAAAPFAPATEQLALPPLPAATLPPPTPTGAATVVNYSNTEKQRREALSFRLRPGRAFFAVRLLIMTALSFIASFLLFIGYQVLVAIFFALFALFVGYRLLRPGWRRLRLVPSALRCAFTQKGEYFEQGAYGAWSRFRLPEEGKLVRLPHSWCLINNKGLINALLDARGGEEPPPELACYPRQNAPCNVLRACLVALCLLLGALAPCAVVPMAINAYYSPSEAELAFRELPENPDADTLRAFVEAYYASGDLYSTPRMEACPRRDGKGLAGYILTFTESEPEPSSDDGGFHLAWETCVLLLPDGSVHDHESRPAAWCPCDDWLDGPPEWVTEAECE